MAKALHFPRFRKPRQIAPITISGVLQFIALAYVVAVASYVVLSWGLDNPELMLATERGYFLTDDGRVFTVKPASDLTHQRNEPGKPTLLNPAQRQ